MRLIDADELIQDLSKWMKQVDPTHPQEANAIPPMEDIIVSTLMTIEEQPTIEPERKIGRWIHVGTWTDPYTADEEPVCQCSVCGKEIIGYGTSNFCSECGADMRKNKNNS